MKVSEAIEKLTKAMSVVGDVDLRTVKYDDYDCGDVFDRIDAVMIYKGKHIVISERDFWSKEENYEVL